MPRSLVRIAASIAAAFAIGALGGCASSRGESPPATAVPGAAAPGAAMSASCTFGDVSCRAACGERDPASCVNLGAMYELGQGVAVDLARARELYVEGCARGASGGCYDAARLEAAPAAAAPKEPPFLALADVLGSQIRVVRAEWSFRYSAFGTGSGTTVHISGHGGNVNLGGNVIINGNVYIYGNVNMP